MLVNAFARTGFALMAAVLLVAVGCRSNTDRIRVLEAERAAAHRESQQSKQDLAESRAKVLETENRADNAEARAAALEAENELMKERGSVEPSQPALDTKRLSEQIPGVEITENETGVTIVLASDITFHAGRADLNTRVQSTLQRIADVLQSEESLEFVRVEGHTDSDPIRKSGWKDNRELSLARANQVRRFLVAHGVEESLLAVEGHGSNRPIAANTSKEGKARNRRVEIVLVSNR